MSGIELYPHQDKGASWLAATRYALLADSPGLGKTAQAITALGRLPSPPVNRVLVICPATARVNWERECHKFLPLSLNPEIEVISYNRATSHIDEYVRKYRLGGDVLILDEAHYLKEPKAKRTQAIFAKQQLAYCFNRIWALTGTPTPNHAGELWVLLRCFGRTKLTYSAFLTRYCNTYFYKNRLQVTGTKRERIPEIRQMLSGIMLRRREEEVIEDLPPLFFSDQLVEAKEPLLAEVPGSLRPALKAELLALQDALNFNVEPANLLSALTAMAQSTPALRRYIGIRKVPYVRNLVEEEFQFKQYEKLVIFALHRDVIEALAEELKVFNPVILYGGMNEKDKQHAIDSFQNDPKTKIFIGNIAAAGTAITLTASNHVLFVEADWSPDNNYQAAKRCYRIPWAKPVFVRFLSISDSVDEKVNRILRRKAQEISEIFD